MATVTYPGVYIEEFEPAAPITGVATNIAAFLGPAAGGRVLEPVKITNWKAFLDSYADADGLPLPGTFYLWYAVRGFFQNGGQVCYVVRVSNAGIDEHAFTDQATSAPTPPPAPAADRDTIVVRARQAGSLTPPIAVQITSTNALSAVTNAALFRPTATITASGSNYLSVDVADDPRQFVRGDEIDWPSKNETKPVLVDRVEGTRVYLQAALEAGPYDSGVLRLADLEKDRSKVFRIAGGGDRLSAGSVVTLSQTNPALHETRVVKSVQAERIDGARTTYRITLRAPVGQLVRLTKATTVASPVFSIAVDRAAVGTAQPYHRDYVDLSMDPLHADFFAAVISADDERIIDAELADPPSVTLPPFDQPRAATWSFAGGAPEDLAALSASDYQRALDTLLAVDDVALVCIPDTQDPNVQAALLTHCEMLKDRFAIFDSRRGAALFGPGSVESHRDALESADGYGALYYPWLEVTHASGKGTVLVPPSGHVAGVFARTDDERGVHKAPAGEEAVLRGAIAVEKPPLNDIEHGQLNVQGINVLRVFRPGGRPVVWGARTTTEGTTWRYVSTRRLFLFIEESIQEGIKWAVFEPNNLALWQGLRRTIGAFLTKAWRDGALFGATPEEAFYVRIDEVLNPYTEQALGRLNIEIGARPAYPAEFIVVRIGIWDGGSEITTA